MKKTIDITKYVVADDSQKQIRREKALNRLIGKVSSNMGKLSELGEVVSFSEREAISTEKVVKAQISCLNSSIKHKKFIDERIQETPAKLKSEFLETLFKETRLVYISAERKIQLGKVMARDLRAIKLGQIKCTQQGLCWPNTETHKLLVNWVTERLNSRYGHNEKRQVLFSEAQILAQKEIKKQLKAERAQFVEEKIGNAKTFLAEHKAKRDAKETRTARRFRKLNYAEQLKAKNKLLFG